LIQNFEYSSLKNHLEKTKNEIDIFKLMDRFGKTPLLYASYKNSENACRILIEFTMQQYINEDMSHPNIQGNGCSGDTSDLNDEQNIARRVLA